MVGRRTVSHHGAVLSCPCCVAQGWRLIRLRGLSLWGSVWHAYPCRSRCAQLGLTSSCSSQGSGQRICHESLACHVAKAEGGVVADPGLGVRPILLGLARPRSFGPLLAHVSWAARSAN
jgi:hypothetical protein